MMKIQFLGTAAAEGQPGLFCNCPTCTHARKFGGKDVRTRSQAIVDDTLLIDFPADTLHHCLMHGIDLTKIYHCLITHTHSDHLCPAELRWRIPGFSNMGEENPFCLYGSEGAMAYAKADVVKAMGEGAEKVLTFTALPYYLKTQVGDYFVTGLRSLHGEGAYPMFYIIENKEGKRLMYAHDTDYFMDEVWEYLEREKPYLSFVSLDCTEANLPWMHYTGHMNLVNNKKVKDRLIEIGCADENTVFCCNHFSHNGIDVLYDTFSLLAKEQGFLTSYDGFTVEF